MTIENKLNLDFSMINNNQLSKVIISQLQPNDIIIFSTKSSDYRFQVHFPDKNIGQLHGGLLTKSFDATFHGSIHLEEIDKQAIRVNYSTSFLVHDNGVLKQFKSSKVISIVLITFSDIEKHGHDKSGFLV